MKAVADGRDLMTRTLLAAILMLAAALVFRFRYQLVAVAILAFKLDRWTGHVLIIHPRISETNGMSVVSGRRLTGFLAGLRRRIRVLCQPRSENCPGLPIFFGEAGEAL